MKTTEEKIKEIVQQYPKTDDCKFQTLGELHKWQIGEITELIQKGKDKEQNRILKELPQNPYPEWLFPMTTKEYVKAIPNEKLRGAISGYMGRWVWDNCIKSIEEVIREN